MNNLTPKTTKVDAPAQIIARLSAPQLFSMERQEDFDALRSAHLAELSPRTAYESTLAEDLVRYQWEMARMRRFRDGVLLESYKEMAFNVLERGDPRINTHAFKLSDEKFDLVSDLVGHDVREREVAETLFHEKTGWRPEDLLARAFAKSSMVKTCEERIADLERRRRGLREDYARLKASTSHAEVADAEVVEAHDDD